METKMKSKGIFGYFLATIIIILFAQYDAPEQQTCRSALATRNRQPSADYLFPDMGCSVIYASDGEVALGGNNEDYVNPFTMAWFFPPENGNFGRVYFGYEGFIWGGGMNDQGLFFDALAVDQPISVVQGEKESYVGSIPDKALKECTNIDCVMDLFSRYHTYDTWYHQFMFGDAEGNSVIIEPNQFIEGEGNYQIATNFYQSVTDIPSCNRYTTAIAMFESAEEFSVDLIRDILDAVHVEQGSPTLYSNVYDLKERTIYLYHYHDFDNVMVFQLEEELVKGYHAYVLADLFPENQDFLNWATPQLNRIEALRAAYEPIKADASQYKAFLGNYALPAEMGLPYPFYSIAMEEDQLYLKIKTDKAWLELSPISETSFYHVSSFSQFEVTFLQDGEGQFNQFLYKEAGREYTFTRIKDEVLETIKPTSPPPTPSPSPTLVVAPTSTDEPSVTSTPIEITGTQTEDSATPAEILPSPSLKVDKKNSLNYWWVLPILVFIVLAGWFLVWRNKS
jgi:hypothetical protein